MSLLVSVERPADADTHRHPKTRGGRDTRTQSTARTLRACLFPVRDRHSHSERVLGAATAIRLQEQGRRLSTFRREL